MKITKLLLPESQPAHALLVRAKKVVLTYAQRVKTPAEFSVDGVTYEALCDGEGVYYQQLEPVVHWPFYQEEEP
mgnify:CR=1 FL=1